MAFADAISMTTGAKSSCELPLTNRDPNNFTEAFPLPKKLYSSSLLLLVFKQFAVQQLLQFSRHNGCHRTLTIENLSSHRSSMYGLYGTGSDVTKYLITGSDVITLISCRFTACFPTGSDVTKYLRTGSDVITLISCRFTACFPTGSDVTNFLVTGNGVIIVISCRFTACFPTGSDVTNRK